MSPNRRRLPCLAAALCLLAACQGLVRASNSFSNMVGGQFNRSKISVQNGIATSDYAVSFDRACAAAESALRSYEITVSGQPLRGPSSFNTKGMLKDGRPVEITVTPVSTLSRVAVRVGDEDTKANREDMKAIHNRIDDDCQVVRRTYNTGFDPVWQAGQKVVPPDQKIQPDNTLGQLQGKKQDGTPVIMTIQRTEDGRTRITIEVGSSSSPQSREDAVKLAKAISEALGVKAEEDP